jgi:hypothetical protein
MLPWAVRKRVLAPLKLITQIKCITSLVYKGLMYINLITTEMSSNFLPPMLGSKTSLNN